MIRLLFSITALIAVSYLVFLLAGIAIIAAIVLYVWWMSKSFAVAKMAYDAAVDRVKDWAVKLWISAQNNWNKFRYNWTIQKEPKSTFDERENYL